MTNQARRETLQARLTDAYREADKLIVTVSSGVLGLSVAFLGKVNEPGQAWVLQAGWIALGLAVVFVFVSLLMEQADRRRRIIQIDSRLDETDGLTDSLMNAMNVAGVVSFLVGLGSLVAFLCSNIN
jgi:hypothetical protein